MEKKRCGHHEVLDDVVGSSHARIACSGTLCDRDCDLDTLRGAARQSFSFSKQMTSTDLVCLARIENVFDFFFFFFFLLFLFSFSFVTPFGTLVQTV